MDLNGDGHHDLLSGSYSRMDESMAGLFQVLWGREDGSLTTAEALKGTDDEPLIITTPGADEEPDKDYDNVVDRICTRPTAIDWDSDGDLDLIVGNFAGTFCLFRGEGNGRFQPTSEMLMTGDDVLRIEGNHADPFCVDWDRDGDLDLLSGSTNGGVQWAENTAGPGQVPKLRRFAELIAPGPQDGYGEQLKEADLVAPTRSTRIWVDDVNEDGKLDILVGDNTTLVSRAEDLTEEEFEQRQADWQARMDAVNARMSELNEETEPEVQQKIYAEFSELYQERESFINEQRTGFVWLYLQK